MDPLSLQALKGTLKSPATVTGGTLPVSRFVNLTCMTLNFRHVDSAGNYDYTLTVPSTMAGAGKNCSPNTAATVPYIPASILNLFFPPNYATAMSAIGEYFVVFAAETGAFVTVITTGTGYVTETSGKTSVQSYYVTMKMLSKPGDIGPLPLPTKSILVPQDSTHVVVGCGMGPNSTAVIHEQYWQRCPESVTLTPGQVYTYSLTVTHGMQQTTSDLTTVQTALGFSTSASGNVGWAAISASLSASFSYSSTTFNQLVITDQTQTYVSTSLTNQTTGNVLYYYWQLTDVITILDKNRKVAATIITGQAPVIANVVAQSSLTA